MFNWTRDKAQSYVLSIFFLFLRIFKIENLPYDDDLLPEFYLVQALPANFLVVAPGFIETHTHAPDGVGMKIAAMLDVVFIHLPRYEKKAGLMKRCRSRVYRSCSGNVRIFFMGQTEIFFERG